MQFYIPWLDETYGYNLFVFILAGAHFGHETCYSGGKSVNIRGDRWGNCGMDSNGNYVPCKKRY